MAGFARLNFYVLFFGIFALVGTGLGIAGFAFWRSGQAIIDKGVKTEGTVVSLSRNSGGSSAPIVQFLTQDGQPVTWYSNFYSSPPSYQPDEKVTLWYLPEDPQQVTLKGFDFWFLPLLFGGFFVVFGGIGYGGLIYQWRKKKKREWLDFNGKTLFADFSGVQINGSVRMNGRSPWVVTCQFLDKASNKVHVFESDFLWYNPEEFIQADRKIRVVVDPNDYKTYKVDLSFLPEVA